MTRIALAEWSPDLSGLGNPNASDVKNVVPLGTQYGPLRALAEISTTGLDTMCLGAIAATDSSGTTNSFAGDGAKLYKLSGGIFSNVSKAGNYTVGGTERWEFAQYGQRVLAVTLSTAPQYYDLASSSLFVDLAGSPPRARHVAVVRDFVVLGNTDTSPNEVAWSGFNNSGQWTAGTNQSDTQTLQGGGWVQAITGGEVGYVFQERAIARMSYVGPPLIFQFDTVEEERGTDSSGSVIKVGALVYFHAPDGFYVWDGQQSVLIGNQKVDNWFATHLAGNTFTQITAGQDPANKLVFWSFVSTDATDTTHPDTLLIYNWATKDWTYAKVDHELLYSALSEGWTLEQVGVAYPIIENVPVSFDSRVWTGGTPYLAAFSTNHQLASFGGDTLAATLQTGDFEGVVGKRSLITNTRPLCDSSSATVVISSRERFPDSVANTAAASMQSNGDCPVVSSGRFHRAQLSIPAGASWSFANGIDIDAQDDGEI